MTRKLARAGTWARGVAAMLACLSCAPSGAQSFGPAIDRPRAGLDRAGRLPLEIIWLQSEIQADMWRAPALAAALQGCARPGAPREGCAVSVRSAWRYSFDAGAGVQPAPIVISSLAVAGAPFAKGGLNLSGSGRVYLVTSDSGNTAVKPPAGVILLAAGSTVQLVDTAYPSIQIEVSAPPDRPLFLGNLAAAEIGRIFALLVPKAALSASAADVLETGRVALRARDSVSDAQVAQAPPATAIEKPASMPVALAERIDPTPRKTDGLEPILVLDSMPVAIADAIGPANRPAAHPAAPRKEIVIASAPAPGAIPALSSELSKLRAEVEAEIARDNARMAEALQGHGARRFRFGS